MEHEMRNSKLALAILAAAQLPIAGVALAQERDIATGFYAGGGLTQSRFDTDNFSVDDIDDEDNSWKVIAGFRFNSNFALEANYVDFGKATSPSLAIGGPFGAEADAFALYAVAFWPIGSLDLFAKLGAAQIDAQGSVAAVLFEDEATELAYGAGLQYRWGNLAARAEYEIYNTDVVGDLDLITLGLTYTFSTSR
jgi:opacity protein-like surface antigen